MTRTELGYALWKEDPKLVAEARVQAKGRIGARTLRRELFASWAAPVVAFLERLLDSTRRERGK